MGDYSWGRLSAADLQPNFWGSMGLMLCVCAFSKRVSLPQIAYLMIGFYTIYVSSSRGSLLAFTISLIAVLFYMAVDAGRSQLVASLIVVIGCALFAMIYTDTYVLDFLDFVSQNLLQLHSASRGLDSGFTGRADIWSEAIELWIGSPVFGVGFRMHEAFLAVSAHNAYIAMLADTGVVGLILYVGLLIVALVSASGIHDIKARRFVVAVIMGYAVYGLFERRTINGGNPYSLLFMVVCFYAITMNSLQMAFYRWETKRLEAV